MRSIQPVLEPLVRQLESVHVEGDWSDATTLLLDWRRGVGADSGVFFSQWRELDAEVNARIGRKGEEKTTHTTYPLWELSNGITVWINSYKPAHMRREGYANTVHNHRCDFATTALTGGYQYSSYRITHEGWSRLGTAYLGQGMTLRVNCEEIHQLNRIEENTHTLLVKSPQRRSYSTSWDLQTGACLTHIPPKENIYNIIDNGLAASRQNSHSKSENEPHPD